MALHFSDSEFERRQTAVLQAMAEANIDAMLLFAQESMYWLTGYDTFGFCFFQCLVLKSDGSKTLLTRSADLRQAQHTSNIQDIRIWTDRGGATPVEELKSLLFELDLLGSRLGVEYDTQGMTGRIGIALSSMLATFAEASDQSAIIPRLRAVKSTAELVHVRDAAKMADDAFLAGLEEIKPGGDEGAVLAAMQGSIFKAGGDYAGNEFIIGSGRDALLCRYKSGRRLFDAKDQISLEWAGASRRYHAAMFRTVCIGEANDRHKKLFDTAYSALDAAEATLRPGSTFGDIFEAHARTIDEAGEGAHRLAACGYSLGATYTPCWMDAPMFYRGNEAEIVPSMSLFIHIILMDSETETAMCLGETFITTDGAPERLSKLERRLIVQT